VRREEVPMSPPTFVRVFTVLFAAFFLVSLVFSYHVLLKADSPQWMIYFFAANLAFYFIGSLGLITRGLLGYYTLMVFLYVLLLSFPIGTLIAVRILRYVKRNSIRSLFT
jgi:hypothetical protein